MQVVAQPFTSLEDYLVWADMRPDEEHYEVVDGQPVMSPSPTGRHQLVVSNLVRILGDGLPGHLRVLTGPWDWVLWETPRLQIREPDVVVVRRDQIEARLASAPLLAVEVLSPTSLERDAVAKRREYALVGLDHYWIVDPDTPQITVYRRVGDRLELHAQAAGGSELLVVEPIDARIKPADLLA
jgi:Uma2 family endonuclease